MSAWKGILILVAGSYEFERMHDVLQYQPVILWRYMRRRILKRSIPALSELQTQKERTTSLADYQ